MAIEPTQENLLRIQTELTLVRAQLSDLVFKTRRRELAEHARLEAAAFALAHRVRDQLLTAPARHAAILAAEIGVNPGALAAALTQIMRAALRDIAQGPQRP